MKRFFSSSRTVSLGVTKGVAAFGFILVYQTQLGSQNGCQDEQQGSPESTESTDSEEKWVTLNSASWNHMGAWLRQIERLRGAA